MDQVATSLRQFHLLDAFADDRTAAPIIVPEGVSGLLLARNGTRPRLQAGTPKIPSRGRRYVLEPVRQAGRPYLLIAATESTVQVNGHRLAHVTALVERDLVRLAGGWTCHVTSHVRCEIGRAPAGRQNTDCRLCHRPLADRLVFICATCNTAVHCDGRDPDDGFNCLGLCSECPGCRGRLLRDGYTWTPET